MGKESAESEALEDVGRVGVRPRIGFFNNFNISTLKQNIKTNIIDLNFV